MTDNSLGGVPSTKVNDILEKDSINHIDNGSKGSGQGLDTTLKNIDRNTSCQVGQNDINYIVDKDLRESGQVEGILPHPPVKNENDSESSDSSNCENEQQSINNILTNVYA